MNSLCQHWLFILQATCALLQAETFVRLTWADDIAYDMDDGLCESSVHIALADGNTLFAYASIIWLDLNHQDDVYRCYGLRSVFTFPASRNRGYGGQVVQAATDYMRQQADADIALLWTEDNLTGFYERHGWSVMADITILMGDPEVPEVFDEEIPMMLFLSNKAQANQQGIASDELYIGDEPW